jgi:sec-independent protein translocase protein TatA
MEALTPWHLALIFLGFMLLFGYKKLPDATRSLGRSLRIFKSELREMTDDTSAPAGPPPAVQPAALPLAARVARSSATQLEAEAAAAEALAAELRAQAASPRVTD